MQKAAAVSFRIEPGIKERLEILAKVTHRSKSFLVSNALETFLDVNEWQIKGVIEAVQEADSPNADWSDHQNVKAKWEAKRAKVA